MYDFGKVNSFTSLACMTQEEIRAEALSIPSAYEIKDGNIFVKGSLPLVLVAHMDTVYSRALNHSDIICKNGNLQTKKHLDAGIGGDDRCGCWTLFQVAQWEEDKRPSLLFCSDEETCAGSSVGLNLLDWSEYKAFVEIDAPNYGVFYSDSHSNNVLNRFMSDVIGLYELPSSYNDISEICTTGNPPGITIGAGYYNQHQANNERVNLFGLNVALGIVREICENLDALDWSVVPKPKKSSYTKINADDSCLYGVDDYDDDDDLYWDYYGKLYGSKDTNKNEPDFYDELGFGCDPANGTCVDCCLRDECDDFIEWKKLNSEGN